MPKQSKHITPDELQSCGIQYLKHEDAECGCDYSPDLHQDGNCANMIKKIPRLIAEVRRLREEIAEQLAMLDADGMTIANLQRDNKKLQLWLKQDSVKLYECNICGGDVSYCDGKPKPGNWGRGTGKTKAERS